MFKTGQALLLPGGRFSGPGHGREAGAEVRHFAGEGGEANGILHLVEILVRRWRFVVRIRVASNAAL